MEETLWHALRKTQLIFPASDSLEAEDAISWDGCEFSKCGRTDRGVSAFGQVVGLKVRSNRPLRHGAVGKPPAQITPDAPGDRVAGPILPKIIDGDVAASNGVGIAEDGTPLDGIQEELPYIKILNRVLPPDIRALAWCPSPPGFSARFSCRERRYRYFFTDPAFHPLQPLRYCHVSAADNENHTPPLGYLNISAMQTAARKFEGLHDFRNFCKIDPSKQIENFERRIFRSEIIPLGHQDSPSPHEDSSSLAYSSQTYAFVLHGSAFLWHQVRHMVAILFLIGQGLEAPSLIDDLLDIQKMPSKPRYEMADDAPLVLWDCIFPKDLEEKKEAGYEDGLKWVTEEDQLKGAHNAKKQDSVESKFARNGVEENVWRLWRKTKIDEVLTGELLNVVGNCSNFPPPREFDTTSVLPDQKGAKVFMGGNEAKLAGKYVPVMQRPRMEAADVVNARWAQKKGGKPSHEAAEGDEDKID